MEHSLHFMELVIFTGLQASGKSTFYRTYFAGTHELVSKDLMRNKKNRALKQARLIEKALQEGRSLVVDNTNPAPEDRASIIEFGKSYGAEIIGYYFESNPRECLERNRQRSGKALVPDVGIYATLKKLARPTRAEGFHRLFWVRIAAGGTFEVSEWTEPEVSYGERCL